MGELVRFPHRVGAIDRALEQLARDLAAARELEAWTVELAFAAAQVGDFEHAAIRAVIMGRAGELADYVRLCELIKIVGAARRHCGLEPGR